MKLVEFEALAPRCIVCDAKMRRIINQTTQNSFGINSPAVKAKHYNINMLCTRDEKCFGYMSNPVSIYDAIELRKFYIGFPKIQIFAVVPEYTQVMTNGNIMKTIYIPFESWLRAKGQTYEKLEKLLLLADGTK